MKNLIILALLTFCVISMTAEAKYQKEIDGQTLHVDGTYTAQTTEVESKTATDDELKFLQSELNNVKSLKTGYKKKAKVYTKLAQESDELKGEFEGYLDNRVDYEEAISGYNGLVECLKTGDATKCTDSKKKSRRNKQGQGQQVQKNHNNNDQVYNKPAYKNGSDKAYSDSLEIRQAAVKKSYAAPKMKKSAKNAMYKFVQEVDYRISMRQSDLVACYKRGGLNEEGVLKVVLKIAPNGALNHIGFKDTTEINDRKVIRCVSRVLYSIAYPRTPNRKVTAISKPFVFNTI
jgi:hypothetical protein